jgi:hypothetical protein
LVIAEAAYGPGYSTVTDIRSNLAQILHGLE